MLLRHFWCVCFSAQKHCLIWCIPAVGFAPKGAAKATAPLSSITQSLPSPVWLPGDFFFVFLGKGKNSPRTTALAPPPAAAAEDDEEAEEEAATVPA